MAEYFKIGKLVGATGLKGEIVLQHNLGKRTDFSDLKALFLEQGKDNLLPFFIENSKLRSASETLLKIEGIDSLEQAKKLTSTPVWIAEEDFNRLKGATAPIALLGYELLDTNQPIGKIVEVIEQPHQMLCTVLYKGNEVMVPVHADNLIKMDQKNKRIHVEIPEGLLDLFA